MKKQGLRLVGLLVVVDAVLLVAAYALSQAGGASWFPAIVFVLIAVLATAFIATGLSPGRRTLVALPDRGGIGVSNSPVISGLLVGLLVAFLLLPVSLAVAWASGRDRPLTAAGPLVLLVVALVGVVPVVVGLVRGRYRLGGLVLTPGEVSYESYLRTHTLPWDQVSAIHKHPTVARLELRADQEPAVRGPRPRAGERPLTSGRAEQLNVPTGLLRMDADRLLRLLEFYRTHPRARHEIGEGTAWTRRSEVVRAEA